MRRALCAGISGRLRLVFAVRPEIPRAAVASVPVVAIAFIPVGERPVLSWTAVGKPVTLPVLPICKPCPFVLALTLSLIGRSFGVRLRSVRGRIWLRLKPLLRLLKGGLPLRRRGEAIRQRTEIAVVFHVFAITFAGRARLAALCERLGRLRGCNQSEIMFGMLQIILRRDGISPRMSVSRELEVFFRDVMGVSAYFDVRPIRFIGSRQRIRAPPIVCRPAAHPLILTWSHAISQHPFG